MRGGQELPPAAMGEGLCFEPVAWEAQLLANCQNVSAAQGIYQRCGFVNEMFMSVFFFSPFLVIKMEEIEGEVFFMNLRYFGKCLCLIPWRILGYKG